MSREIGLSRLTAFELTNAELGEYAGEIVPIPWIVNAEVSKTVASFTVYADNVAEISSSKATGAEITLEISSDMPPSLEAKLTGVKFENGLMIAGTDDIKPQWGLAYETVMDTGALRRYFFTNCTISKNEQANETISDSIVAQTYSLTVNAIPLPTSKELMLVMDEDDMLAAIDAEGGLGQGNADKINDLWEQWFEVAPRPIV